MYSTPWFNDAPMASLTDFYAETLPTRDDGGAAHAAGDNPHQFATTTPSSTSTSSSDSAVPPPSSRLPLSDIRLTFAQFYGKQPEMETTEGEMITSLQYNNNGELLAVGDRGGRVSLYKRDPDKLFRVVNYHPYIQFQSHEPEFDYLKSIEIEEKIIQVKWVPRDTYARHLLTSNDKTVKLWRIGDRSPCSTSESNNNHHGANNTLSLPRVVHSPSEPCATLRKSFANAHTYHINTVAVNSDQETFISCDDLRINLWNLEVTDQSFVIVDVKPEAMETLQEVITTCTFHPSRCNIFAYSTSKGVTRLCDMRVSALCDRHAKLFHEDNGGRGYFSEIVHSVGDAQFSRSGRYLATRDYMELKIWDTLMESRPMQTIPIHGFLASHLHALYDNDSIFDKFTVSWSSNDTKLVTGSYDSLFSVTERSPCKSSLLQIPKECTTGHPKVPVMKPKRVVDSVGCKVGGKGRKEQEIWISQIDFSRKVLASQWSPTENVLALTTNNNLYFFQEKRATGAFV